MRASFSHKLSAREQRLATVTASLIVVSGIFFLIVKPIMSEWQRLDREIERKTDNIRLLNAILGMEKEINAKYDEYSELLAQESTDEVVRNRLMQEISAISARSQLKAPVIREGATESHKFYKRYFVDMDVAGSAPNLALFLANLQKSNELFRVESLSVSRKAGSVLNGRMEVSKILVPAGRHGTVEEPESTRESPPEDRGEQNLLVNGDMELWSMGWGDGKHPDAWNGDRVTTARSADHAVSGFAAARVQGEVKGSILWQEVKAQAATNYRITWHVARISGWVSLRVLDVAGQAYYDEADLPVDSQDMRVYTQTFRTLGEAGGPKRTLLVTLFFHLPDSEAYIDDVRLVRVGTTEKEALEE